MNKVYKYLKSKKNKIKIRAILMLVFLLGLNTYAWFIYITKVNNNVNADVAGWDVTFTSDGRDITNTILVSIDSMLPGMENFIKEYGIHNRSEVQVSFKYQILSLKLFDNQYSLLNNDYTEEEIIRVLAEELPFNIHFNSTSSQIDSYEDEVFTLELEWPYEADEEYIKINRFYEYVDYLSYYQKVGDTFIEANVTSSNFTQLITTGLYLTADDADSYWGEKSHIYKENNEDVAPLQLEIELKVQQNR